MQLPTGASLNVPDTTSFKMNLTAFWGQTNSESISAMQQSTLPRARRACWDQAAKPGPTAAAAALLMMLLDCSQLAQIWEAWPVLTHAGVCTLFETAEMKVRLS